MPSLPAAAGVVEAVGEHETVQVVQRDIGSALLDVAVVAQGAARIAVREQHGVPGQQSEHHLRIPFRVVVVRPIVDPPARGCRHDHQRCTGEPNQHGRPAGRPLSRTHAGPARGAAGQPTRRPTRQAALQPVQTRRHPQSDHAVADQRVGPETALPGTRRSRIPAARSARSCCRAARGRPTRRRPTSRGLRGGPALRGRTARGRTPARWLAVRGPPRTTPRTSRGRSTRRWN